MVMSPRFARVSGIVGFSGVVCLSGYLLWSLSIFGKAPGNLNDELKAAHADGLPLSPNEFREQTQVDENENAAPILYLAIDALKDWRRTTAAKAFTRATGHSGGLSAATSDEVAIIGSSEQSRTKLIGLLNLAASKRALDFHRPWERGFSLTMPEIADERAAIQVVILTAIYKLRSGNVSSGLDDLELAGKLTYLLGKDPVMIALVVQCGLRSQICDVVEEYLKSRPTDETVLKRVPSVLASLGPRPDMLVGLRAEFVSGLLAVATLSAPNANENFGVESSNSVIRIARYAPVRTVYEWRYVQLFRRRYSELRSHTDSVVAQLKDSEKAQIDLERKAKSDWTYGLADILMPIFSGLPSIVGESEARIHVLTAATDLLREKAKTGKWPTSPATTAAEWKDPFSEKPLKFVAKPNGFLIYSIGRNLKDEGGKPRPKRYLDENYDIPFEYSERSK